MAEFKATKAAFVGSLISLLLSCAMLLGTTFAWFNDTVSSSSNRILTGNLDIDLLMYKTGEYVSIAQGNGDIFAEANGDDINWEPGKTEIVYLAVENIGSLALKYDVKLDVDGELSGALDYAILYGKQAGKTAAVSWKKIKSNQKAETGRLKEGLISIVQNGKLNKEESINYFAIAVHMPDDAENKYQGESITVDLTLTATQAAYEKDSFGKDYDKNAQYEESKDSKKADETTVVTIDTTKEFKKFTEAVNSDDAYGDVRVANNPDVYVKLTTDIDLSDYTDFDGIGDGKENCFDGVFDGCDHTIKNWTADNKDKPLALFRTTNNAHIRNLTIDNFNLGKTTDKGDEYGILIGAIGGGDVVINKVSIKNSVITGQKTIGVIVGAISEGHLTITNCTAQDITINNAEGYTDVVGILLGSGYFEKADESIIFTESKNTSTDVIWFNADARQKAVPAYNCKK